MKIKKIISILILIIIINLNPQLAHAGWTTQTTLGSKDWFSVASSADGTKLAAIAQNDYVYTSSDSGANWTQQTLSGSRMWTLLASSADGTKLVAMDQTSYVYTSSDSGVNWTSQAQVGGGLALPYSLVSSADGNKLALAFYNGSIYTSTNGGVSWTEQTLAGTKEWFGIATSADGTKLAAIAQNDYVYTSSDSGATWTQQTLSGSKLWFSIASSTDGTKLVAGTQGGYIYTSSDSGVNWTEQTLSGTKLWLSIASSDDGSKIVASTAYDYIYTSADGGVNWTEQTTAGSRVWIEVAISSDGNKIVATETPGYIYTFASTTTPTVTTGAVSGISSTAATVSGDVTADGGASITERGIVWNTSANPTTSNSKNIETGTTGSFTSNITSLSASTTYYVRAYATNSEGTSYGNELTFATTAAAVATTSSSSGGMIRYGCKDQSAINYDYFSSHRKENCVYKENTIPNKEVTIFNRNLSVGSKGPDVKALQSFLNSKNYIVATSGAGSTGKETNYFGKATKNALIKFQKASNIFPSNGYFGPITRAFITK